MRIQKYKDRSTAIIHLQERGYELDFVLGMGSIACIQEQIMIEPQDFEVTELHLFLNDQHLEENCVIYAIDAISSGLKGILMASYGICSDGLSLSLRRKLNQTV